MPAQSFRTTEGYSTFSKESHLGPLLTSLHDGSLFGELALQNTEPRRASVVCLEDCELLRLRKEDFLAAIRDRKDQIYFFHQHVPSFKEYADKRAQGALTDHPSLAFASETFKNGQTVTSEGVFAIAKIYVLGPGANVDFCRYREPRANPAYVLSRRPRSAPKSKAKAVSSSLSNFASTGTDVSAKNKYGQRLLHHAALDGSAKTAQHLHPAESGQSSGCHSHSVYLVKRCVAVEVRGNDIRTCIHKKGRDGKTPLGTRLSSIQPTSKTARALMDGGAVVTAKACGKSAQCGQHLLVPTEDCEPANFTKGARIQAGSLRRLSAGAVKDGDAATLQQLIDEGLVDELLHDFASTGTDVSAKNKYGQILLHHTALDGSAKTAQHLHPAESGQSSGCHSHSVYLVKRCVAVEVRGIDIRTCVHKKGRDGKTPLGTRLSSIQPTSKTARALMDGGCEGTSCLRNLDPCRAEGKGIKLAFSELQVRGVPYLRCHEKYGKASGTGLDGEPEEQREANRTELLSREHLQQTEHDLAFQASAARLAPDEDVEVLDTLEEGRLFGTMAALPAYSPEPFSIVVRCTAETCTLYSIDGSSMQNLPSKLLTALREQMAEEATHRIARIHLPEEEESQTATPTSMPTSRSRSSGCLPWHRRTSLRVGDTKVLDFVTSATMEVTLSDTIGLPQGTLLSIRVGSTRRQAVVDSKFKLVFPKGCKHGEDVKVDALQQIGSNMMKYNESVGRYDLDLDDFGSKVSLHMREVIQPATEQEVSAAPEAAKVDDSSVSHRHRVAVYARKYLDEHKLLTWAHKFGLIESSWSIVVSSFRVFVLVPRVTTALCPVMHWR
ncbi:hypothetical protein AK812_SmicGene21567 [Symbiodinium microadriaticum]|uniref:Cyclic nucleotide-binding domain-containing protein n=1 Tax=Symbiodinium microadriaticum TaxID=2951 RepID=A0A1Q9DM37_SYMMI|nr:hypothetical protein AK812_SmicGene21567 [Symbiodinium microadriaticum]